MSRTSITKAQRQTAAGAELISLCQTMTEDGRLSEQEVGALWLWLDENRTSDLPAIAFLSSTLERVLADGRITPDERRELFLAIELVLPTEIRQTIKGARVLAERLDRKLGREAEKEALKEARARNTPINTYDFMVAGATYEGRPAVIKQHCVQGATAYLARDRANAFSRNAIQVRLENGMQAGFVPEEFARDMVAYLDSACKHTAYVKKIYDGRYGPIPIVVAALFIPETDRSDAVSEEQVPAAQKPLQL